MQEFPTERRGSKKAKLLVSDSCMTSKMGNRDCSCVLSNEVAETDN